MEELPSTGSLQLKVAFDRHECTAANWVATNRGPLWRRPLVLGPPMLIGGLLLGRALGPLGHPGPLSIVGGLLALVLGVGGFIYAVKLAERRSEENALHELHPDRYTLNDAGLEISGVDDLALMSWPSMTRVHETKRFFLFVAGSDVLYLPKRALDAEQAARVRALIARNAPAAVRPLPAPPSN